MTTYSWPLKKWEPVNRVWQIKPITQMSQSPYTGTTKAANSGSVWTTDATFQVAKHNDATEFQTFLEQLEGPTNPVWMYDWRRPYIRAANPAVGQPWSDSTFFTDGTGWTDPAWNLTVGVAALAGSRSLTLTGFPVSQAVLYKGDLLGVGDNLVQVMSDVTSDGGGVAMISILPGLRKGVLAATPVVMDRPRVLMRMTPDSEFGIARDVTLGSPISLRFVEALDLL